MSKLEELIQKLCPNGVEYKRFDEACTLNARIGWQRLTKAEYKSSGEYLLITGTDFTSSYEVNYSSCVYVSEERYLQDKKIQIKNGDVLITKDGTLGKVAQVSNLSMPATLNGGVFVVRPKDESLLPRYIMYFLLSGHFQKVVDQQKTGSTISHLTQALFSRLQLPVPPLEVQREIVCVLDSFTLLTAELTAKLTAELTARKKQYEFYRNKLLSFDTRERENSEFAWKTLGQLGKWSGGKTPSMAENSYWEGGTIPWISSKDMKSSTLLDTEDHITEKAIRETSMTVYPRNSIAVVTRSGILKHTFPVAYVPFETTINQDIKILVVDENILPRYAFHLIQGKGKDILAKTKKQGGTVDSLDFQKVLNYRVPVPSLAVQERLVKVLDNFDTICTDLNIGLPAEIETRKKQYEYYRDSLLTFAETGHIILADQTRPDQTRPDQTRPDQTRPDQTRPDQTRPDQTRPDQFD